MSGTQLHVLVAVLHVPVAHAPQSIVLVDGPQPVSIVPHRSWLVQSAAVWPVHVMHWCVDASQICPVEHDPQLTCTPHSSVTKPHAACSDAHVAGTAWHVCVTGSQTELPLHAPHSITEPHVSTAPHAVGPMSAQIAGTQPSPAMPPSARKGPPSSPVPCPVNATLVALVALAQTVPVIRIAAVALVAVSALGV